MAVDMSAESGLAGEIREYYDRGGEADRLSAGQRVLERLRIQDILTRPALL